MLAYCEWTSKLCSVGSWLLYYASLFLFNYDLVPIWIMNVFPLVTKTYNQKNLSKTLKPSLLVWIFEIVLACFFVAWKQFLAQTHPKPWIFKWRRTNSVLLTRNHWEKQCFFSNVFQVRCIPSQSTFSPRCQPFQWRNKDDCFSVESVFRFRHRHVCSIVFNKCCVQN